MPRPLSTKLSARLVARMRQLGLEHASDLAEQAELPASTVYGLLERNQHKTLRNYLKLAGALKVSAEDLLELLAS